jgi:hypothetical protein
MKTFRYLMVTAALLLLAVPSFAQTTLNSTTLAAAVTDVNAKQFQLTSTTNVSVGDYVAIVTGNVVREIASCALSRARISPSRAIRSPFSADRKARKHANGSTVYTGAKTRFYGNDVNGACTQAQEQYLPHISVTGVRVSVLAGRRLVSPRSAVHRQVLVRGAVHELDRSVLLAGG